MSRHKLGIVNSSSISKSYGGVAPFIKNLDPFLSESFDVTYIYLPEFLYRIQFIPRRFIFVVYLLCVWRRLKNFDMILSHVPEGSYVVSFGKVPFVHVFHGNFNPMSQSRYWYGKYFTSVFELMERRIIKKACLMYTVGKDRPGIPKIYNPIHHFVERKETSKRSGFIFAGRLEKIKNIDRIIKVYSKLPESIQKENTLYIAGVGTQENLLKELASSLPISGKVIFLGNLSNDELIEVDSSKRILVMASSQEGFPMAIAEALSLGVPVVSTDTGDISRILKSNQNGFLLPIDFSYEEYTDCIIAILRDYDRFSFNASASSEIFKASSVAKTLTDDMNRVIASK